MDGQDGRMEERKDGRMEERKNGRTEERKMARTERRKKTRKQGYVIEYFRGDYTYNLYLCIYISISIYNI
jgi:hypothetical protein